MLESTEGCMETLRVDESNQFYACTGCLLYSSSFAE